MKINKLAFLVELYLARSDTVTHSSADHGATSGETEVQSLETPLSALVHFHYHIHLNLVSRQYHLARFYLLHVAHLDLQLHAESEPA